MEKTTAPITLDVPSLVQELFHPALSVALKKAYPNLKCITRESTGMCDAPARKMMIRPDNVIWYHSLDANRTKSMAQCRIDTLVETLLSAIGMGCTGSPVDPTDQCYSFWYALITTCCIPSGESFGTKSAYCLTMEYCFYDVIRRPVESVTPLSSERRVAQVSLWYNHRLIVSLAREPGVKHIESPILINTVTAVSDFPETYLTLKDTEWDDVEKRDALFDDHYKAIARSYTHSGDTVSPSVSTFLSDDGLSVLIVTRCARYNLPKPSIPSDPPSCYIECTGHSPDADMTEKNLLRQESLLRQAGLTVRPQLSPTDQEPWSRLVVLPVPDDPAMVEVYAMNVAYLYAQRGYDTVHVRYASCVNTPIFTRGTCTLTFTNERAYEMDRERALWLQEELQRVINNGIGLTIAGEQGRVRLYRMIPPDECVEKKFMHQTDCRVTHCFGEDGKRAPWSSRLFDGPVMAMLRSLMTGSDGIIVWAPGQYYAMHYSFSVTLVSPTEAVCCFRFDLKQWDRPCDDNVVITDMESRVPRDADNKKLLDLCLYMADTQRKLMLLKGGGNSGDEKSSPDPINVDRANRARIDHYTNWLDDRLRVDYGKRHVIVTLKNLDEDILPALLERWKGLGFHCEKLNGVRPHTFRVNVSWSYTHNAVTPVMTEEKK